MKKSSILGVALASAGLAAVIGGNSFAATMPTNRIGLNSESPETWHICVTMGTSYSGSPFVLDISGPEFATQTFYNDFANQECKDVALPAGQKDVVLNLPIGVPRSSVSLEILTDDTLSIDFSIASLTPSYLGLYGGVSQAYEAQRASIVFDGNGGTGSMASVAGIVPSTNVTLPKNTIVRTGYEFKGWNTKKDGSGTTYADEATVPVTALGDIKLYAQWEGLAVFDSGSVVNGKIKMLGSSGSIKSIKQASALPDGFDTTDADHIVSANESISPLPIYAWFDNEEDGGIIYYYSDARKIRTGEDMSGMLASLKSLRDISGASIWDTSETTNMASVFECDSVLSNIFPVMNWNTSKVTSMSRMFGCNVPITNTIALETKQRDGNDYVSWDVSNVKDMSSMFYNALSLSDITHLASWNTASLEDASGMFSGYYGGSVPLEDIYPIRTNKYDMYDYTSWDMSHVKSIANMFAYTYISNISSLATWNTSSLESISGLFSHARLTDLTPLAGWNTSNVNTFYKTFEYNSSLTSTAPLINWDSSNVETMAYMFDDCRSLSDLSGLVNWNTSKVTNMFSMFGYTSLANASMEALRTIQRDGNGYVSWDVSHVLTMDRIFEYSGITDIEPLESWDVQSSTTMKYAFTGSARPSWYHG